MWLSYVWKTIAENESINQRTSSWLTLSHACIFSQVKLDAAQAGKPSRVLHFRGVPTDATEGEIVQLGLPFGRMTNLVLAKKKNQVRY